jgi:hypothetical protein
MSQWQQQTPTTTQPVRAQTNWNPIDVHPLTKPIQMFKACYLLCRQQVMNNAS